ncbi:MAG: hypothetical protein Kow0010_26300 [Dehalococcoidia bacterium]
MVEHLSAEERVRARKQAAEQSIKLAIAGRWKEAAALNREIIERIGPDVEAYNRLGKALTELGQISEARKAYQDALQLDPANTIARRNLDRLASMQDTEEAEPPQEIRSSAFIEESGKAATVTLQAVNTRLLAPLDAGDAVQLEVKGNAVNVLDKKGNYLGMVDPRIGLRLARLMEGGNLYSAALVSTTDPVRVIIREIFQHPSQLGKVSFPQSRDIGVRAYTRPGLLRSREEEFLVDEEEEEDVDEEEEVVDEEDADEEEWSEDDEEDLEVAGVDDTVDDEDDELT